MTRKNESVINLGVVGVAEFSYYLDFFKLSNDGVLTNSSTLENWRKYP